jgi:hypothetical protein
MSPSCARGGPAPEGRRAERPRACGREILVGGGRVSVRPSCLVGMKGRRGLKVASQLGGRPAGARPCGIFH